LGELLVSSICSVQSDPGANFGCRGASRTQQKWITWNEKTSLFVSLARLHFHALQRGSNPNPQFSHFTCIKWSPYARDLAVIFRQAANSTFPIWLLLFGIYFPEPFPETSRWAHWRWLKWVFIVPLAMFALFDVIEAVGWLENYSSVAILQAMPQALHIANVTLSYVALAWPVGLILVKHRSAISADAKRRLRLLAASATIALGPFFLLRAISLMMDLNLEEYFPEWLWFGTYVLYYLFPLALAYLIVVHRAMDVRVVMRQGLQYALAKNGVRTVQMFMTVAVFFAAVTLVAGGARNRVEKIVIIVLGLAVVVGIQRGSERLRIWIDRRFFREAYQAEQILSDLSDRVRTMVEPASLLQMVATRISETLHVARIAVLLDGSPFRLTYAMGCGVVP